MRKKQNALIISFSTTTAAMHMEKCAALHRLPGRLIPLPREISAGCGLAWKAEPEARKMLLQMMQDEKIEYEAEQIVLC